MFLLLELVGLTLVLPGLAAVGYAVWQGPVAWDADLRTFWGTPISLFVFWIGLAHAGTLLSAVFLALNVKLDRRTALLAELSTLVSLLIAMLFPLVHLGIIGNFYMVAPLLDARGVFANMRSPLVWDLCCILIYGILSLLFFAIHLAARPSQDLENPSGCADAVSAARDVLTKIRRPMAWLLFPLVLWVHTIVSLDFATTFVPEWRGSFFPLYFIAGAIFSGLSLVNLLLSAENYRVRLLEKLMLACSWIMIAFWLWNFALKGDFCVSAFIFAGILPQLFFVEAVRESKIGWRMICGSVLVGMLLERVFLVAPSESQSKLANGFGWVDYGLLAFGVGLFLLVFFAIRRRFSGIIENDELMMGDVDESKTTDDLDSAEVAPNEYFPPLTTPEFRTLRLPLLCGILVALLFCIWAAQNCVQNSIDLALISVIPVTFPIVAFFAGIMLCVIPLWQVCPSWLRWALSATLIALGGGLGFVYAGGSSVPAKEIMRETRAEHSTTFDSRAHASLVWASRCAACHGVDGKFNEKFVREFYPVPQKLTLQRFDSLGEDSLVQVILNGRVNMNPYGDRLSEDEARGLVRYMRALATADSVEAAP